MKRIVQTPDHVMILIEMVHDARIVRLYSEHVDPSIRKWLGDSIGWWEGDTLVVDTTNFNDTPAPGPAPGAASIPGPRHPASSMNTPAMRATMR